MSINIKEFNDKLSKNLCRVLEITDENIVVAYKQYDLEKAKVGELIELPEEVSVQSIKELNDSKAGMQAQIDEINAFLILVAK